MLFTMSDTQLQEHVTLLLTGICFLVLAGQFDNHFWRLMIIAVAIQTTYEKLNDLFSSKSSVWATAISSLLALLIMHCPHLRFRRKRSGCVFVTGADSGMGQATVIYLAKTNKSSNKDESGCYDTIFAGAYDADKCKANLKNFVSEDEMAMIKVISLDVTADKSVAAAAEAVKSHMKGISTFLSGLVNYHGVAFNGPIEYMPMKMYNRQMDVNFTGNIRMTQHFLPLLKEAVAVDDLNRGRLIFTGTGGGPCSPCPPLLSAYMSSKFAGEAFCQCLRQELFMTDTPIDVSVINPGFVKPTQLMAEGKVLTDRMWKACEDQLGNTAAKDAYGPMMDHFIHYSALQPGTHVTEVCKAAEHALTAKWPRSSYKVGIDSKLAPIVGMLPTGARELIARHGIYGVLSPAGTVKGYSV